MPWDQKDFDTLLEEILNDYRNQSWIDPETGETISNIDTSVGQSGVYPGRVPGICHMGCA